MLRPRRVLFLDHTAAMGGGEIALFHLVTHLDRARYEPVVLLFSTGPLVDRLTTVGVETHVLPLQPEIANTRKDTLGGASLLRVRLAFQSLRYCWELSRHMRRLGGELVHTNSLKADILGGVAARLAGLPLVWHVRDRIERDYLPTGVVRVFRLLCRIVPDRVIANSAATLSTVTGGSAAAALARAGAPAVGRNRFVVVHDGTIAPSGRDVAGGAPRGVGERPRSGPVVGIVGRIAPWKGQDVFLRAAARVRRRFPDARFQVIGGALFGEADFQRRLQALSAELGLGGSVEFTGFRSDVADLIHRLDVLVHASVTGEPFGQVAIEGMAAGKPVVATRGGGIPEIVVHGETGLLVPMADDRSLADAIDTLLADPARAEEMGLAGRRRVVERFTIERTAGGVQRVLDGLAAGAPAARPPIHGLPHRRGRVCGRRAPERRTRILFASHTAALGGAEIALLRTVCQIDRDRFDLEAVLFEDGPLAKRLKQEGVLVHVLPLVRSVVDTRKDSLGPAMIVMQLDDVAATLGYVFRLARFACARGVAVVHTNSLKAHVIGGLAARIGGRRLVWSMHSRIADDYLPASTVRLLRHLCRLLPNFVVANSLATLATLELPPTARASVVYPGVEVDSNRLTNALAVESDKGRGDSRKRNGQRDDNGAVVGIVGRISAFKGQDVFLRAAALVIRRFPRTQFKVIGGALFGEADYGRELHRLAKSLGLDGAVEFTGQRADADQFLRRLDVLVHASVVGEPFGLVVAEGMAAGRPVVATDGGGIREIVEHGVTGLLIPMGDAAAMAEAICLLLENPERADQLGARAREWARRRFDVRSTARSFESVYEQVCRDNPVPGSNPRGLLATAWTYYVVVSALAAWILAALTGGLLAMLNAL